MIFALYPAFYGKGAGVFGKTRIRLNPSLKRPSPLCLKPSSDSAYRSASLRNRRGRLDERLEMPNARIEAKRAPHIKRRAKAQEKGKSVVEDVRTDKSKQIL